MTDKTPRAWDGALEQEFYTPEEIAASDARVGEVQRERVIKGLECCGGEALCIGEKCTYYDDEMCIESLHSDVRAMLKAQEPVKPIIDIRHGKSMWRCGSCATALQPNQIHTKFCFNCGKAVKWDACDREKVIEGLEFTLVESCWDADRAFDEQLMIEAVTNAITLLKAQEPRVLGWDEVCGDNRPFVVWIETRHGDTTEPLAFVDGEYVNTDCTLFVELNFENQRDYMADKDNGFRFWTAQPTLEEMEAASWA